MNRRTLIRRPSLTAAPGARCPARLHRRLRAAAQAKPQETGVQEVTFLDWEASLEGLPTETVLKNSPGPPQNVKLSIDTLGQNYEEKMRTLLAAAPRTTSTASTTTTCGATASRA